MKSKFSSVALMSLALSCLMAQAVQAADPPKAGDATTGNKLTTGSDAARFAGDVLTPRVPMYGKTFKLGDGVQNEVRCIPAESKLRGGESVSTNGGAVSLITVEEVGKPADGCGAQDLAVKGQVLVAEPEVLGSSLVNRRGWTYGTLIVPYKYQFRGDRSMSGGATLGGYIGMRQSNSALAVQYVVFGGATKVEVPKVDADGNTTTESLAGLSYGLGILGTLKNDFKLGLVVGADRVSKSAGYVNNGKPWISLSLGVDFTQ